MDKNCKRSIRGRNRQHRHRIALAKGPKNVDHFARIYHTKDLSLDARLFLALVCSPNRSTSSNHVQPECNQMAPETNVQQSKYALNFSIQSKQRRNIIIKLSIKVVSFSKHAVSSKRKEINSVAHHFSIATIKMFSFQIKKMRVIIFFYPSLNHAEWARIHSNEYDRFRCI